MQTQLLIICKIFYSRESNNVGCNFTGKPGWLARGQGWCANFPLRVRMTLSPFIHTLKKKECFGRVTITWHAYPIQLPEVNDQFSSLCSDWSFMDLLYINIYSKFWNKRFDTRIFNKHKIFTFINMKILLLQRQWVFPLVLLNANQNNTITLLT